MPAASSSIAPVGVDVIRGVIIRTVTQHPRTMQPATIWKLRTDRAGMPADP